MIIGHLVSLDESVKIDTRAMDRLTQITLDEINENPVIEEAIRTNPVIMKELSKVVEAALKKGSRAK